MASDVPISTIAEVASTMPNAIAAGPFGSNLISRDYVDSGVPVIRGRNLQGRWVSGEFVFVSESKADTLRTNTAQPGDIIFTQRGTLGQVSIVPPHPFARYVVSQSQMKLTVDSTRVDERYIYYACTTRDFQAQIHNNAVAAGVPHINLGILRRLQIPLPSLEKQCAIAETLGALDDRIDNLRQTNAALEAIAATVFVSRFEAFEGVPAEDMQESELGLIPNEWRISTVGEIAELIKGCSYKGAGLSEVAGAYMFNLGCFNSERMFATENLKRYTGEYRDKQAVVAGDLIIANTDMTQMRDILGRSLIVPSGYAPGFISHHVYKVQIREGLPKAWVNYLFFLFRQPIFRKRAVGHATGTTVLALARDSVLDCPLVVPPMEILMSFDAVASPILSRISLNLERVRILENIRDLLLPRLVSGRLRVSDAERELESA